jgi:hypothetical protein
VAAVNNEIDDWNPLGTEDDDGDDDDDDTAAGIELASPAELPCAPGLDADSW